MTKLVNNVKCFQLFLYDNKIISIIKMCNIKLTVKMYKYNYHNFL